MTKKLKEEKVKEDKLPKYKNVVIDGEEKIQITFPDGKKRIQSL